MKPASLGLYAASIKKRLAAAGLAEAEIESRMILARRSGFDFADIISTPDYILDSRIIELIETDISRRLSGEPLSRIYGVRAFYGLEFQIDSSTLDPRPDTELIVDIALERFSPAQVFDFLDLGAGSGCISIAILKNRAQARAVAVDKNMDAIRMTRQNARAHGVDGSLSCFQGDWAAAIQRRFDLVVSNPPYIESRIIGALAPEVKNHDPILALDGGDDGLQAYRDIFFDLSRLLKPQGIAMLEIGFNQSDSVTRLAEKSGFHVKHTHADLGGRPRVLEITHGDK